MKTLEEVKAHLVKVGYNHHDMPRIEGFLFGKGLYEGDEFEIEYIDGNHDFYDFKDWFEGKEKQESSIDWSDFGRGDFIHVEKDLDALVLSDIYNGAFVGTTGSIIHKFVLTNESRPCYENEIDKVLAKLEYNGVDFLFNEDELVPHGAVKSSKNNVIEEELKKSKEELKKSYDEFCHIVNGLDGKNPLKQFALELKNVLQDIVDDVVNKGEKEDVNGVELDNLEIDAKNAVENIIASLHANELDPHERELVLGTLEALVVLGNEYE